MQDAKRSGRGRWTSLGGWLTLVMGVVLVLFGLPTALIGVWLLFAGGSPYYVVGCALFTAAGYGLIRERRWGYWLFLAGLLATVVWAFAEAGPRPWPLLPRLAVWLTVAVVSWLVWPLLDRRLQPSGTAASGWRVPAGALGATAALMLVSGLAFRNAGLQTLVPDQIDASGVVPASLALPAEQTSGGDWSQYGGTSYGQRFSPLAQITPDNAGRLQRAWVFHTGALPRADEGPPREFTFEATALKVGPNLITCTPHVEVIAIDAASGRQVWRFAAPGKTAQDPFLTCRGVSSDTTPGATGPCATRVLFATITARMYALDAATGQRCPGFGTNGEVDLTAGMGLVKPGFYYVSSPPAIVRGKAVIGGWVEDNYERGEPSGVVRAFDTRTGALAWAFDMGHPDRTTLPPPGQTYTRGTPNVWAPISADPKLGLVFLPTGNETPDFFGAGRQPSSEKYASSVIALDADTGKVRWNFQTVHHDLWDQDIPAQPVLVDVPERTGAAATPAVLVATKRGEVFVFDRRDGRPIVPVQERPVPQGAVAGDFTSRTQPYPLFPSLRPPTLTEASMWGITPVDQAFCRLRFHKLRYQGQFTPPSEQGTLSLPGSIGTYEWGGVSVDPRSGVMFANTGWVPMITKLRPAAQQHKKKSAAGGDVGGPGLGTPYSTSVLPFMSFLQIPCSQPPWGHMTAIDVASRRILWRGPLGNGRDNGPFGIPTHVPVKVGTPNMGGTVSTAGGVLFVAATADRTIRAIDAHTGKVLWSDVLPAGGQATPTVYQAPDGREFVVISAGGHTGMTTSYSDAVIAYALPADVAGAKLASR